MIGGKYFIFRINHIFKQYFFIFTNRTCPCTEEPKLLKAINAVKIIMKDDYKDYHSALKFLNLETLSDRRNKLCIKFAKKCLKIENMKKLFPLNQTEHCMKKRYFEKYFLKSFNTERYRKSSIPAMI